MVWRWKKKVAFLVLVLAVLALILPLSPTASAAVVVSPDSWGWQNPWLDMPDSAPGGTWTPTGNMVTSRAHHTATLLADGRVLVVGGYSNGGLSASAELYDPSTGTWSPTGSMTTARMQHIAILLSNGQVLVAGGYTGTPYGTASAELYDPSTGTWSATGSMNQARVFPSATLLPSGKVLVAGGADLGPIPPGYLTWFSTAELYDPGTGTWSPTGSMNHARFNHTATLLLNGKVLVTGGQPNNLTAELYDPGSGTWFQVNNMSVSRESQRATLLANGQVLVADGTTIINGDTHGGSLATAELYDPNSGIWSGTGSMEDPRQEHTQTMLPSGKVLVAGGFFTTLYSSITLASAELYDPSTGTWSSTGSMGSPRLYHRATLLPNGQVLVTGGYGSTNDTLPLATAELYSPPQPPNIPNNVSPPNGATGVSLTPALQSSAFSDPDVGDTHAATQWQIRTSSGSYSSPVYDSGPDSSHLTTIAISSGILNPTTTYYWQVKHQDNHGAWSSYSSETSFTTGGLIPVLYGTFAGRVTDAHSGAPVAGAAVEAQSLHSVYSQATTDGNGYYTLANIPLGDNNAPKQYAVVIEGAQGEDWAFRIATAVAGSVTTVDMMLCYDADITGRVVDGTTGNPIAGASVRVEAQASFDFHYVYYATTDQQGSYTRSSLPLDVDNGPLSYSVTASAAGYNPQTKTTTISCGSTVTVNFGEIAQTNQSPHQPTNTSPTSGATGISLTPILTSSGFSDPDVGDTHAATQWQIRTSSGSYSSPVYDSGTTATNLTSITVPSGRLNYSTNYYWHVRHQDNHGAWSDWSVETFFTTTPTPNTPVGSPVTVPLPCAVVTFSNVSGAGTTSCTSQQGNPAGGIPSGFRVRGLFVDITTTAFYSGPVTVCIPYDPSIPNPQNLKLFHWNGSNWEDVTTEVNAGSNTICGQVSGLSPFFVGEEVAQTGEGCFIATAAYGSYLDSHVQTLRDFRDSYMVTNPVGRSLVSAYYKLSPPLAGFIDDHPTLKPIVRVGLMPAVALSTVAVSTTLAEKMAIVGVFALVSVALVVCLRRKAVKGGF